MPPPIIAQLRNKTTLTLDQTADDGTEKLYQGSFVRLHPEKPNVLPSELGPMGAHVWQQPRRVRVLRKDHVSIIDTGTQPVPTVPLHAEGGVQVFVQIAKQYLAEQHY